jgi:hypothetical protein
MDLPAILCAVNNSKVQFHACRIANNQATAVMASGTARVIINASSIENNKIDASGAGLFAGDSASVLITGDSRVSGNTALGYAWGGVAVTDQASVLVSGHSTISSNTCAQSSGGGVVVGGRASFTLSEGFDIVNNTSVNRNGGSIYAFNHSTVSLKGAAG